MAKLTWADIFVDASALNGPALFERWPGTVQGRVALIGASAFGDLFFHRPDGSVHRLDVLEGGVGQVAATFNEFSRCMNTPEWQQRNLLADGVALLVERGVSRGSAQFYGFAPHPLLTGKIDWQRVMALDAVVWHSICAQVLDGNA
jgi:hypothetical protein